MKRNVFILAIVNIGLMFCACTGGTSEKNKESQTAPVQTDRNAVNAMHEYNLDGTVEVGGVKYTYEFAFNNDKELPVVVVGEGLKYYDNHVKLYINKGSQTVYEHTFTKESFRGLIPAKDYQRSVLAGFNFNYIQENKHDRFYFIAVVGDPDETSDLSYSIGIAIDRNGGISTSIETDTDIEPVNHGLNKDPDEFDA